MTTWTKLAKSAIIGFLLMEDGGFLLQETEGKIVLGDMWGSSEKHQGSFTKVAKH